MGLRGESNPEALKKVSYRLFGCFLELAGGLGGSWRFYTEVVWKLMGSENPLGPLGFGEQPGFLGFGSVVGGFRGFGGCGAVEFAICGFGGSG